MSNLLPLLKNLSASQFFNNREKLKSYPQLSTETIELSTVLGTFTAELAVSDKWLIPRGASILAAVYTQPKHILCTTHAHFSHRQKGVIHRNPQLYQRPLGITFLMAETKGKAGSITVLYESKTVQDHHWCRG